MRAPTIRECGRLAILLACYHAFTISADAQFVVPDSATAQFSLPVGTAEAAEQTADSPGCLTPSQFRNVVPDIQAVSLDVLRGPGEPPPGCFDEHHADGELLYGNVARWQGQNSYQWKASGLFSNPLYFEDVSLERYGRTSCMQNIVSGAKFFGNVAILPYKMGVDCPRERVYTLGYTRPGNCAPAVCEHLPCSMRGLALQAGAVTGFVFLFP